MAASDGSGTVFTRSMAVARTVDGAFVDGALEPVAPLALHPAAHGLHYGSTVFEGMKAHRGVDGVVRTFRLDAHLARLERSAAAVHLPVPPADLVARLVREVVADDLDAVPQPPGALYLRPALVGTVPNIWAAAGPSTDALLFVLAGPVSDYFGGGLRVLSLWCEEDLPRTTPQFGAVKAGANYAMALGPTLRSRAEHGTDQVLFAPGGRLTETGAANLLLLSPDEVLTPALDGTMLPGITRDSLLTMARDAGMRVTERAMDLDDLRAWAADGGEAAVCGTAAVMAPVGTVLRADGERITFADGQVGEVTRDLTGRLRDLQTAH